SPVTDARELAHQNHWGSVSSASPSPYAGVDPLCARTTPTRAEGRRPLRLFVCQATNGGGEMSVRLVLTKSQQGSHYLLERFRGTLPSHTFREFLSYLFFLPTLVVGPIHRFQPFLDDYHTKRWRSDTLSEGMERILYGYVKVAVLANFLFSTQMVQFIGSIDP